MYQHILSLEHMKPANCIFSSSFTRQHNTFRGQSCLPSSTYISSQTHDWLTVERLTPIKQGQFIDMNFWPRLHPSAGIRTLQHILVFFFFFSEHCRSVTFINLTSRPPASAGCLGFKLTISESLVQVLLLLLLHN